MTAIAKRQRQTTDRQTTHGQDEAGHRSCETRRERARNLDGWPEAARSALSRECSFIPSAEFIQGSPAELLSELPSELLYAEPRSSRPTFPADYPAYLGELYRIPLLAPEGEAHLFRKMNYLKFRANQLRATIDMKRRDWPTIREIEACLAEADAIRNRIAECNLRLVVSIARRLGSQTITFEELVSEGNLILLKTIEKFNYALGYRFSTYATHAVQRHFFRCWKRKQRSAEKEFVGEVDMLVGQEELSDESDPIGDPIFWSPLLSRLQDCLTGRELQILRRRFDLGETGQSDTLQELSAELGICKERVRQIQHRALQKLRHFAESRSLTPELIAAGSETTSQYSERMEPFFSKSPLSNRNRAL